MIQFLFQANHYSMKWLHKKHILNYSKYEIQASEGRDVLCNQRSLLAVWAAVTAWVVKSRGNVSFPLFRLNIPAHNRSTLRDG